MLDGMNATLPELRPPSVHRVPHARLVDRVTELRRLVRGRRVIDIGFVDEGQLDAKRPRGAWLHEIVAREASEAVGIDADAAGVEQARTLGFDGRVADVEDTGAVAKLGLAPADVVVAGELIEHLDRPGAFLDAVQQLVAPAGALVLTTPNGLALTNVLGGIAGRELVNPDHVMWFSWRTLETLLSRHGWRLDELAYYRFPRVDSGPPAHRAAFNTYQVLARPLFRLRPNLADGIVAVARLDRC
jgi:2-polyprenyl-3-methyl-5-hydroxy-6-metoxy-1,4-benzoquinol methylase